MQGIDEHTAGGEDVFAAGAADGGGDAVVSQVVAEPLHLFLIAGGEAGCLSCALCFPFFVLFSDFFHAGMETNEIDAAVEVLE